MSPVNVFAAQFLTDTLSFVLGEKISISVVPSTNKLEVWGEDECIGVVDVEPSELFENETLCEKIWNLLEEHNKPFSTNYSEAKPEEEE